jgi:hypothetical protein
MLPPACISRSVAASHALPPHTPNLRAACLLGCCCCCCCCCCCAGFATYTTDLTTAGIITHKVWIDPGWGTGNTGGWRVILTCDAFKAVYGITMLTNTFTEQAEGECQISVGLDGNVITTVFDTAPTFAPAPGMVLTYSMQLLGE